MEKLGSEAEKILSERFGKDNVIALATIENDLPYVRNVNAFYENKAFYIITHALSNKMKQLAENPHAAISVCDPDGLARSTSACGVQGTVILNAELIEGRVLPDCDRCFPGIAVSHDIGERFFCNADKAVFDFPRDCFSGVIAVYDRAESKIIDQ